MNSLSELTDDIESQLAQLDETTKQVDTLSSTLAGLEQEAKTVRQNIDSLDLPARAKKLAAIQDQLNVVKPEIEAHKAAAIQQKKKIVTAAADLRNRFIGEADGRARTRSKEVADEITQNYDTKRFPVGIAQIAEAHRSVQKLRETERALTLSGTTDDDRLAFARRLRSDFLSKLS